jgi:hypothetical protein
VVPSGFSPSGAGAREEISEGEAALANQLLVALRLDYWLGLTLGWQPSRKVLVAVATFPVPLSPAERGIHPIAFAVAVPAPWFSPRRESARQPVEGEDRVGLRHSARPFPCPDAVAPVYDRRKAGGHRPPLQHDRGW